MQITTATMDPNISCLLFYYVCAPCVALQHSGRRCTTHTTALILREQDNRWRRCIVVAAHDICRTLQYVLRKFESKMGYML